MASDDNAGLEALYAHGEKLASAKDKAQFEQDYLAVIGAATGSSKAKLFAAQQIPRFFKFFPQLSAEGINAQLDLCEDDDMNIRLPAIRGLPYLCKDTVEHLPKIADVLCQLLISDEQEQVVVQNSLMQVLRQDPKESLSAVFKHVESPEEKLRENVIAFLRKKVFPNKASLLVPASKMERHVTDLIKGVQDVTGEEFSMFLSFLSSLSLFGPKAAPERMQEIVEVVEAQADLQAAFDVADSDHIERVMACLQLALPFFARGGSNSKFLHFIAKHVFPALEKLPADKHSDLLKAVAEASPSTSASDARALLPSLVTLVKAHLPPSYSPSSPPLDFTAAEALLFAFHQVAAKAPNATNALCGYHIVTGQPSDHLGEDFKDLHADWLARLSAAEEEVKKKSKALMADMASTNKDLRSANEESKKVELTKKKAAVAQQLKCVSNIEKLLKGLKVKSPQFFKAPSAPSLSWLPDAPAAAPAAAGAAARGKGMGGSSGGSSGRDLMSGAAKTPNASAVGAGSRVGQAGGIRGILGRRPHPSANEAAVAVAVATAAAAAANGGQLQGNPSKRLKAQQTQGRGGGGGGGSGRARGSRRRRW